MKNRLLARLTARSTHWIHLRHASMRHLALLVTGVFLLFSVIGFYTDIMQGGTAPYGLVLAYACFSGLNAVLWVITLARLPMYSVLFLLVLQMVPPWGPLMTGWIQRAFHPRPVPADVGIHFAATSILVAVVSSYFFLGRYMRAAGLEAFRIRNELELAQGIQKTLVPPIHRKTGCFEIYGISEPSEKVGGDLVDVVELPGGDVVAYLADIAGHGLQAGILMGMLKTAARTALAGGESDGGAVLSSLMQTLNQVLPQVKEAHMYATFTALRLNGDGTVFCGMAASPPVLLSRGSSVDCIEQEQFPLGLLPVPSFPASELRLDPGDLLVVATDGVLEVTAKAKSEHSAEYGTGALSNLVKKHTRAPLPELASTILSTVRAYGAQMDDQTLLLVRRLA